VTLAAFAIPEVRRDEIREPDSVTAGARDMDWLSHVAFGLLPVWHLLKMPPSSIALPFQPAGGGD